MAERGYKRTIDEPDAITPFAGTEYVSIYQDGEERKVLYSELGGVPASHAASHQISGGDPVGTQTRVANSIPVTDSNGKLDTFLDNASTTTRGLSLLAASGESSAIKSVAANDLRLSDSRTPSLHGSTHLPTGSDDLGLKTAAFKDIDVPDGVPVMVDGKIQTKNLPAIAINDTFVVSSQSAMLALTAEKGDCAIRTDINSAFILADNDPTILANWVDLTPGTYVTSVDGENGAVSLRGKYLGYWIESLAPYEVGEVVAYNGMLYYSDASANSDVPGTTSKWVLASGSGGSSGAEVGITFTNPGFELGSDDWVLSSNCSISTSSTMFGTKRLVFAKTASTFSGSIAEKTFFLDNGYIESGYLELSFYSSTDYDNQALNTTQINILDSLGNHCWISDPTVQLGGTRRKKHSVLFRIDANSGATTAYTFKIILSDASSEQYSIRFDNFNVSKSKSSEEVIGNNNGYRLYDGDMSRASGRIFGYNDGAVAEPVDGIGGFYYGISPLNGLTLYDPATYGHSLRVPATVYNLICENGSSLLGNGFSKEFEIEITKRSLAAQIEFDFMTKDSYSDGYVKLFLFNVGTGTMIPLSQNSIPTSNDNWSHFVATFNPVNAHGRYRIIWHCTSNDTTGAKKLYVANIEVGARHITQGAAIGNIPVSLTYTNFTPTDTKVYVRRVGSRLHFDIQITGASSGSGNIYINGIIPSGLSSTDVWCGYATGSRAGVSGILGGQVAYETANNRLYIYPDYPESGTIWSTSNPGAWGAGSYLKLSGSLEIAQWVGSGTVGLVQGYVEYASNKSTTDANDDTPSNYYNGIDGATFPAVTANRVKTVSFVNDILPSDDVDIFIASPTQPNKWLRVGNPIDGADWRWQQQNTNTYGVGLSYNAGSKKVDVIWGKYPFADGATFGAIPSATWATYSTWRYCVRKTSAGKPGEILPLVRAKYYNGNSVSANNPINFSTKKEDTHSCVTTGSGWKFTAPISGVYQIESQLYGATAIQYNVYVNGAVTTPEEVIVMGIASAFVRGCSTIRLNAGDYIDIRPGATSTAHASNSVSITLIGR